MPLIRAFDTGQLGLQPTEIGVESVAAEGRRLGQFYNQVGLAKERFGERAGQQIAGAVRDAGNAYDLLETHRQITQGSPIFTSIYADMTQKWNDIASSGDPNDPSVAAKFMQTQLEPALEKFRNGFTTEAGQNWAEHHIEQLRQHFMEKTTADMSTRAGIAATVNAAQTKNSLSVGVYNDPTEKGVDFSLSTIDSTIGGQIASSPTMKDTESEKLRQTVVQQAKESVVKAAIISAIEKTGEMPGWASNPKYSGYVNATEMHQFEKYVQQIKRQNAYQDRQAELLDKQRADLKAHKDINDIIGGIQVDPNNPNHLLIPSDSYKRVLDVVRNNPDSPSAGGDARTAIDWLQHQQSGKTENIDNPDIVGALFSRVTDPNNPLTNMDVLKAELPGGGVTTRTGTVLRGMINEVGATQLLKDPLVHTAIEAAKEKVGYELSADGKERFNGFMMNFLHQYMIAKNAGTLQSNALDTKDPNSFISKALQQFTPDPQTRMLMHYLKSFGVTSPADLQRAIGTTGDVTRGPPPQPKNTGFAAPKDWQWSPSLRVWKDTHGNRYDAQGHQIGGIKPAPALPAAPGAQ